MAIADTKAAIGVVATSSGFYRTMKKVSDEKGIDVIVKIGAFRQGIEVARTLVDEHGVGAIISRGATGRIIENSLELPSIVVEITSFDLLKAYHGAKALGKNILFIDAYRDKYYYEMDVVESILGISINRRLFYELNDIAVILTEAKQQGIDTIVATAECVIDYAKKIDLHGVMIDATEKDINEALDATVNSLRYLRHERENNQWITTVLDNVDDGMMSIEYKGIIRQFNKQAAKILRLEPAEVLGRNISELTSLNKELYAFINGKMASFGKVIPLDGLEIVFSRIPIYIDNTFIGMFIKMQQSRDIQELEGKVRRKLYQKGLVAKSVFNDIVGESVLMNELKLRAKAFAKYDTTILIQGDSGTGKELFAQSIHNESMRKKEAFVAVNCAALSESLLESELFGYDEGAFTGAKKGGKLGLFELAHGGTIFLDEISAIASKLQAKLLRVIQEKEIMRLGSDRIIPVNVRIICAANSDLFTKVKSGEFRDDLYYRINTLMLSIPPLHVRKEDIPAIAKTLAEKKNEKLGCNVKLSSEMLQIIRQHKWNGNVREMEGFIERYIILSLETSNKSVTRQLDLFKQLLSELNQGGQTNDNDSTSNEAVISEDKIIIQPGTLKEIETQVVRAYLQKFSGNRTKVCQVLGLAKTTMWRKYADIQ